MGNNTCLVHGTEMHYDMRSGLEICDLCEENQCPHCYQRCEHGYCACNDDDCPECSRQERLEQEAEDEANFQRNVVGPLLGFTEEGKDGNRE